MEKYVSLFSILLSGYLIFNVLIKVSNMLNEFGEENLNSNSREIKNARIFIILSFVFIVLNIISIIINIPEITVTVGIVSFVYSANHIYRIFDEMEKFEVKVKDSDILDEFLKETQRDAKEKSKK